MHRWSGAGARRFPNNTSTAATAVAGERLHPFRFLTQGVLLKLVRTFAVIAMTSAISPAQASNANTGYVSYISAMPGVIVFNHSGSRSTLPGCQLVAVPTRWAVSSTTPDGQAKISLIMMAYSMHKRVIINGSGACTDWSDTETASIIQVDE